ncbi:MAG: protoporphyrinogen/coproporphyrinogen oxidase [Panacagrimonas sp.]
MTGKRALVVGGGPAGASAAFRLQRAGVQVRMIERDARIGGRTRTEHIDGYIVDIGAGLLPGTYQAVYRLMQDAGLANQLAPMTSPTAVIRDGRLHYLELSNALRSMLGTQLLGLNSKLHFAAIGLKALGMWKTLGFDSLAGAAPYDTETLSDYAERSLTPELYEYLVNPTEKMLYTISGSEASVVDFFWCVKNLLHPKAYCVKGGMDCVVTEVSRNFEVATETEALGVTEVGNQVEVRLRDKLGRETTESVDFCVIATPARDAPKIDRGLSQASRQYLEALEYSTLTDLHLRLRERPDEKAVLIMVPDATDPDLAGIVFEHNKGVDRAPVGKGAISAYFMHRWARQVYALPDEEIYRRGMAKIERVLPRIGKLVEGYLVQRWDYAATVSSPGHYKKLAGFVEGLNMRRRVQLAGDYFSLACVNSAVTSGEIAATRLVESYL